MPYSQSKFSPLFLWRAHWQSGFNDSIGRMQCDYKSMGRRKRLDLFVRLALARVDDQINRVIGAIAPARRPHRHSLGSWKANLPRHFGG